MRGTGPYDESGFNGPHPGPGLVEEAVHPYISQSIAAERVKDRQRNAERAWLVRQARALRHTATATPAAKTPATPAIPATQPAQAAQPTGARLVRVQAGPAQRQPADNPAGQPSRAA
jgi:hypothetical protein